MYYKTFSFVRGEPYVAFFAMLTLYYLLVLFIRKRFTSANAALLGIAMGLCALSRQWGLLLFPAVFLFMGWQWRYYRRWRVSP